MLIEAPTKSVNHRVHGVAQGTGGLIRTSLGVLNLGRNVGTKRVPTPSKELAGKEIGAAEDIDKRARTPTCAGRNNSRRAILLKFVRLAHNSVTTPTAEQSGVRATGGRPEDNLSWHLKTSTTT